jgi:hypothetical protein
MKNTVPISRTQQIMGVLEHPNEFILRNATIICPYEEIEVRYFEEHGGLYFITMIGEEFETFAGDGRRARVSLQEGCLPIFTCTSNHLGCKISQTSYATLLEGEKVVDGNEPLIAMVQIKVENLEDKPKKFPITFTFNNCFVKQVQKDAYWSGFLMRDDIACPYNEKVQMPKYPYPLYKMDNLVVAKDKGVIFSFDGEGEFFNDFDKPSIKGTKINDGWQVEISVDKMGESIITFKLPYLPLPQEKAGKLNALSFDEERKKIANYWKKIYDKGASISIPGSHLSDAWKIQTAYTMMLIDRQNKGDEKLLGKEIYKTWGGDNYPEKVLSYPHLSPTLYEFIWAQESCHWVMGMLDRQGYHELVERCFEVFFELQGVGECGVYDKSILPDKKVGASYMGTTAHAWLNSNGGVLSGIATHYRLTKNKKWIYEHKESILRACRWQKIIRQSTKKEKLLECQGIMPRGQSTDITLVSGHLQWYYTDVGTILGLKDILLVMKECAFPEYQEFLEEYEDYKKCLLRSLDYSLIDVDDMKENVQDYDYSQCKYMGALESSKIEEFDEKGMPIAFKDMVLSKAEAISQGVKYYMPSSPELKIPFKKSYMDSGFAYVISALASIIDFNSDKPLYDGAIHSGKDLWEGIKTSAIFNDSFDIDANIFFYSGFTYNDYLITKMFYCDQHEKIAECIKFVERYGMDKETFSMSEAHSTLLFEGWHRAHPFALVMAAHRSWLASTIFYEIPEEKTAEIGKAISREWMEDAMTNEEAIKLENYLTYFGKVSVSISPNLTFRYIDVEVKFFDLEYLPEVVKLYVNHPQGLPIEVVDLFDERILDFNHDRTMIEIPKSKIKEGKIQARFYINAKV